MRVRFAATVCVPLVLAGCATAPKDIAPTYVPTMQYEHMSCRALQTEAQNVSGAAAAAVGVQQQKADNDKVAMGVGLVIFWPALLFMKGNGANEVQVAQLKGQMNAIEAVSNEKHCGIVFQQQ